MVLSPPKKKEETMFVFTWTTLRPRKLPTFTGSPGWLPKRFPEVQGGIGRNPTTLLLLIEICKEMTR